MKLQILGFKFKIPLYLSLQFIRLGHYSKTSSFHMTAYKIYLRPVEPDMANEQQTVILYSAQKAYGMIPNMY